MKNIIIAALFLQVLSCAFCHAAGAKVVFLKGTGCAGKTSIAKVFKENGWQVVDEDAWYYERFPSYCKALFPEDFEQVEHAVEHENILHAIMRNQILFKRGIAEDKREQATIAIKMIQTKMNERSPENEQIREDWHNTLRADIIDAIKQGALGAGVVVDSWLLEPEELQAIRDIFPSLTICVYVSFAQLVRRTIKRNTAALLEGKCIESIRFFHQALTSFMNNFELSHSPENAIDVLTKADFMHACNIVDLCLSDSPTATGDIRLTTRGEFSRESFKEYCFSILEQFDEQDCVYVKPKFVYDYLVRTDECDSHQAAFEIEKLCLQSSRF